MPAPAALPAPAATMASGVPLAFVGLAARDLALTRGERTLFAGLGFELAGGEVLVLTGSNGSGKSSLLRALIGLAPLRNGSLALGGAPIAPAHLRQTVLYQGHAPAVKAELQAIENLALSAALDGTVAQHASPGALDRALAAVGLSRQRDIETRSLSQGQRQRLQLARFALALDSAVRPLWLMDEPSAALDDQGTALLHRLLSAHLDRGGSAIVATHLPILTAAGRQRTLALATYAPVRGRAEARPAPAPESSAT